jgi:hypothetical protein
MKIPNLSSNPRVLVVGGNTDKWTAKEREYNKHLINGIETWVYATDGTYCNYSLFDKRLMNEFDIIIYNTNHYQDSALYKRINDIAEKRPSNIRWMTLLEADMTQYIQPFTWIQQLFNLSDLVNTINEFSLPFFQSLTTTKVVYLGVPYPVEAVRAKRTAIVNRNSRALISPFLLQRWNDVMVAKQLNIQYDGVEKQLRRKWVDHIPNLINEGTLLNKNKRREKAQAIHNDSNLYVQSAWGFDRYYQSVGQYKFWINLDERYTWGRYVLDASALGVPIITTRSTGHARHLFPETMVETHFDIDKAVEIGQRLLDDKNFYERVSESNQQYLDKLSYDIMRDTLYSMLLA